MSTERLRPHLLTFLMLLALTVCELVVIRLDAERAQRITALVGLAMTKAALVLWVFMDLRRESRALRLTAVLPFLLAPGFAVVLMLEAAYRARHG